MFDDVLDEAFEDDNRDENEENRNLNQAELSYDNSKMLDKVVNINSPVLESGRSRDYQVYNGAFKDIYTNCPQLLIPLVNEMFGTEYNIHTPIFFPSKDQPYSGIDLTGKKFMSEKYPDSLFVINGQFYHIECECDWDNDIIVRIVKYNQIIASNNTISNGKISIDGKVVATSMVVPNINSGIFYIKNHLNVAKDNYYTSELGTKNIPCFIVPDYSLNDLIENNLIIAFPFYMVKYENFLQGKTKESKQLAIENDLEIFYNGLEKAITNGIITKTDFHKIIDSTQAILDHLISDDLDEGMVKTMFKRILDNEFEEGLRAMVFTLKELCPDFESLYEKVISNKLYANVTKDHVKRYY